MTKVRIVTDSTADLPRNMVEQYNISVVSLKVVIGQSVYRDGLDITPKELYRRMREEKIMATTSQPSPGEFVCRYQQLIDEGNQVISIHLSGALSGTLQSAVMARQILDKGDIEVIDTKTVSMGLGLIVLAAAQAAQEGRTKEEILKLVSDMINQVKVFFTVETLEYLEKGGRIGKAQAFLGSLLSIKPVCGLEDGVIVPLTKARGAGKSLDAIVELVKEKVPLGKQIKGAILHGDNLPNVMKLHEKLVMACSSPELLISEVGPVVGAHTGPGVIGIAFYVV